MAFICHETRYHYPQPASQTIQRLILTPDQRKFQHVKNWKIIKFDYFVSCHVFTYLKKKKIEDIIKYIKKNRPKTKVIVAITKQGWLNKLGAYILNEPDAHTNFNLSPIEELNILSKHMKIIKKKNIFFLTDIYMFEF